MDICEVYLFIINNIFRTEFLWCWYTLVYKDRYGRPLEALRLIVTQRCNYTCTFCHREGDLYNGRSELKLKHYDVLARGARGLGVVEYKLTGGEPLLRNDIADIIRILVKYSAKVSLTTNGSLLKQKVAELADSGLHHINVSLHSLREDKFKEITGGDLSSVLEGVETALSFGLKTKINVVILKENLDEIDNIIEYASNKGIDVNLIQLMPVFYYERDPVRRVELYRRLNGDVWLIEEGLRKKASRMELRQPHNRTVYVMPSGIEVTVIKGYSNPFACITCTRMRITHDGLIKTCLYRENPVVDLRECLEKEDEVCVQRKLLEALMLREPGFKLPYQLSFTAQSPGLSRRKGGGQIDE